MNFSFTLWKFKYKRLSKKESQLIVEEFLHFWPPNPPDCNMNYNVWIAVEKETICSTCNTKVQVGVLKIFPGTQ